MKYLFFFFVYNYTKIIIIIILIWKTKKFAKKHSEMIYFIIIIFSFVIEHILSYINIKINSNENYMLYSFLINLGYIVTYTACIFFLVGEKIIKIKRNPDDSYLLNGEEKELETKVLKNKINKNKELKFVMTTVVYDDNNNSSKNESSVSDTFITKNYSYSSDITKN